MESMSLTTLGGWFVLVTLIVLLLVAFLLRRGKRQAPPPATPSPPLDAAPVERLEPLPNAPAPIPPEAPPMAPTPVVEEVLSPATPASEAALALPVAAPVSRPAPPIEASASLFDRMRAGLAKTQASVAGRLDALLRTRRGIDPELFEELEEILVTADFGMKTTRELISALESRLKPGSTADPGVVRSLLKEEIRQRLREEAAPLCLDGVGPFVIMVVGVNGAGKTTTIGKLARQFTAAGKKVVLGAGDTFRAAAAEQLAIWGERTGVDVIRHTEGADPAAVAFDAAKAAVARKADILILDTAGRLHTKVNLMEELKKIRRVLAREIPGAPHETLLILDATTGQNALSQARLFKETVEVTGLALTKLDGTAKGGIVVAIGAELGLPVRYVGIGEGVEDLRPFDPDLFVEALFPGEEKP